MGEHLTIREDGWPCQRVRLAIGVLLFFVFEVTIAQQLPTIIMLPILGIGVGCAISAFYAIRSFKIEAEVDMIMDSIKRSRDAR